MKKRAWGFGLAAALALLSGQARAQSSSTGSTGTSDSTDKSAASSPGNTTDNSAGSMGTGSGSMSSGANASTEPSTSSMGGHFDALTGKVQNFDRSKNELMLSGSDRKLKLDSSTRVMRDGSRASIDDIKEGDQVRASYSGSGDELQVKSLEITSAGTMGSSGSSSSSEKKPHGGANAPSGNSGDSSSTTPIGGNAPSGNSGEKGY